MLPGLFLVPDPQVVVDGARVDHEPPIFCHNDLCDEAGQEVAVVGDDGEGPFEGPQGILQDLLGAQVEVVRRFVEDQEIGRHQEHPRQRKPALLSAGQDRHPLEHVVFGKEKMTQQGPEVSPRAEGRHLLDALEHRPGGVERVGLVLGIVGGNDLVPLGAAPALDRLGARQDPGQRRLAGAVDTEHGDAVPPLDGERDPVEHASVTVALVHALELQDVPARPGRYREPEGDLLLIGLELDEIDLLDALQPALNLSCLRALGPEALDEALRLADHLLLVLEGRLEEPAPGFLFAQIVGVVARILRPPPLGDLDGATDQVVQEAPVVRDKQDGPRVGLQVGLEPLEGFDVQVVRRFVEKQHRRLPQEEPRQFDPHLPAAAELPRGPVKIRLPEAEPEKDLLGPGLDPPALAVLDAVLDAPHVGKQALDLGAGFPGSGPCLDLHGDLVKASLELLQILEGLQGLLEERPAGVPDELLGQVADGREAGLVDRARVGLDLARDDLHQRRFARPVGADQGNPVTLADEQGEALEEDLGAVLLGDVLE